MTHNYTIICVERRNQKIQQAIINKIKNIIRGHGRGWVFTPGDFKHIGSRVAVESALRRLKNKGTIRRLSRGLYDFPKTDPQLGVLEPTLDQILKALEKRDAVRLQPSGAYAANVLGLTSQVPMKIVLLTDGPTRRLHIGNQTILLKRTTPRNMQTTGRISGTVFQALRWLGKENVDDHTIGLLKSQLTQTEINQLVKDLRYAPAWIADVIMSICDEDV